jgi:uncharacterized protein YjbJ (UPF0337 family)
MNIDILKGKWNQMKGEVKKSFGKLTDDDMLIIEGDMTKASGILQERYGYSREEAEKHWTTFTNLFAEAAEDVKRKAGNALQDAKDAVKTERH